MVPGNLTHSNTRLRVSGIIARGEVRSVARAASSEPGKATKAAPVMSRKCIKCGSTLRTRDVRRVKCGRKCQSGYSHQGRVTDRDRKRNAAYQKERYSPAWERRFLAWDGEGEGDRFTLLANSDGDGIKARQTGIGTEDCLTMLLDAPRDVSNVWFAFGYDVNMMLRDLSWHHFRELADENVTYWRGYRITYIPRKILRVSDGTRSHTSYDAWGFFQSSFVHALQDWGVKTPSIIVAGKRARQDFGRWPMDRIIQYNAKECDLLVSLMDRLRKAINDAGWYVSSWHGAGALSGWFLRTVRAHDHLRSLPKDMEYGARCAYFGGRIDASGWGTVGDAFHYDITSAYPWGMTQLPSLTDTDFRRVRRSDSPYALCHIRWDTRINLVWNPFPYRERDGTIVYPPRGEGWYWNVEIQAAQAIHGRDLKLEFLEVYEPTNDNTRPLQNPIVGAFKHRAQLKKDGNPAHVPIKLGLNSLYGKMAQRVSFGRRPRYYSLAWAGMVTAFTRAKMAGAIHSARCYCAMTDSVTLSDPLPKNLVKPYELGGWGGGKVRDFACIEAGIYEFEDEIYTRGFELESLGMTVADMVRRFEDAERRIPFVVNRFVGMKLALQSKKYARVFRQFVDMPREISSPHWDGTSKRYPMGYMLQRKVAGEWHPSIPRSQKNVGVGSYPYVEKMIVDDPIRDEDRAALECVDSGEE